MSLTLKDNLSPPIRRLAKGVQDKRPILEAMGLQLQSLALRAFNEPALRPAPWPATSSTGDARSRSSCCRSWS